jgi:hypothetical protein
VAALIEAITPRHRVAVLLGAWCGMRRGEIIALKPEDIDLAAATVTVRENRVELVESPVAFDALPKTDAGKRTITVPPHVLRTHRPSVIVFDQHTCAYALGGEVSAFAQRGARNRRGMGMGARISKSFKVAPGVRVRLNAKSTSVTLGGRGSHYTVNSKGRRTSTVKVPGAGVSVQHQSSGQSRAQSKPSAQSPGRQALGGASSVPPSVPSRNRLSRWGCVSILASLAAIVAICVVIEIRHNHHATFPPIRENLKLSGLITLPDCPETRKPPASRNQL